MTKPIIGQEAVCPDGLGRVIDFKEWSGGVSTIRIDTYVNNRGCNWDSGTVQLVPIPTIDQESKEVIKKHELTIQHCITRIRHDAHMKQQLNDTHVPRAKRVKENQYVWEAATFIKELDNLSAD